MSDEKNWSLDDEAAKEKPKGDAEPLLTPKPLDPKPVPMPPEIPVVHGNPKGMRIPPPVPPPLPPPPPPPQPPPTPPPPPPPDRERPILMGNPKGSRYTDPPQPPPKKSGALFWIVVAGVVIAAGVALWFFLLRK